MFSICRIGLINKHKSFLCGKQLKEFIMSSNWIIIIMLTNILKYNTCSSTILWHTGIYTSITFTFWINNNNTVSSSLNIPISLSSFPFLLNLYSFCHFNCKKYYFICQTYTFELTSYFVVKQVPCNVLNKLYGFIKLLRIALTQKTHICTIDH